MRVSSVCGYSVADKNVLNCKPKCVRRELPPEKTENPAFCGKAGFFAGAILGGAAVGFLAFVTAPVIACAAAAVGLAGGFGGDKLENKIRKLDDEGNPIGKSK